MEEKQTTAVQWLVEVFKQKLIGHDLPQWVIDIIKQSKQMEKDQIKEAFEIGYNNGACVQEGNAIYHGSNYYNETFKH
jgi:hypothetical protein